MIRLVTTFVTAIAAFYFMFWIGGAVLLGTSLPLWLSFPIAIASSLLAARFVWAHVPGDDRVEAHGRSDGRRRGLIAAMATGAIVTGAIAFAVGFFGPIVFMPDANQGPLLGLFITGPLGFLLGGVGGGVYWAIKRNRHGAA